MAYAKRKAPKTRVAKSCTARVIKKTFNLAHLFNEDCSLFSESNCGKILDNKLGQFSPMPLQHSKDALPCSNAAAYQKQPHYMCTNYSSLADIYLRNNPYGLLYSKHFAKKG